MHAEDFGKAIKCFGALIADHPEEPEVQERAKVLIQACEKRIHEKSRTVLRSADDHYNVGIADLNRRELDSAIQHLQHANPRRYRRSYVALACSDPERARLDPSSGRLDSKSGHLDPEPKHFGPWYDLHDISNISVTSPRSGDIRLDTHHPASGGSDRALATRRGFPDSWLG